VATTKKLNVPDHVREIILDRMEWDEVEGKTVGRIKLHLERQTYLEVNKVLEALGGKWNRAKKFAGHVFDHDPRPALSPLEEDGELEIDVWGFFPTPPDVVRQMLDLTDPKAHEWVLEPSAGDGAILGPLVERTRTDGTSSTPITTASSRAGAWRPSRRRGRRSGRTTRTCGSW